MIKINDYQKIELEYVEKYDAYRVTWFELMGGRWVALGDSELWDRQTFNEEFEEFLGK